MMLTSNTPKNTTRMQSEVYVLQCSLVKKIMFDCVSVCVYVQYTVLYLCIAKHFEHVRVEGLHRLVVAREDLLLDGAQVQRLRHLLVVLAVPGVTGKHRGLSARLQPTDQWTHGTVIARRPPHS